MVVRSSSTKLPQILALFVACAGALTLVHFAIYRSWPLFRAQLAPVLTLVPTLALPFASGRWKRSLVLGIAVLLAGFGLIRYAAAFTSPYFDDFRALYGGAQGFFQQGTLYDLPALRDNHLLALYKYPPFFALLVAPFTGFPLEVALQLWRGSMLLLLLASALILTRWARQPPWAWSSLGLVYLLISFQPLQDSLAYAQVDMIMLVGLSGALWALERGRMGLMGGLLAFLAAFKVYPVYLLAHSVVLKRWKSIAAFAVALLAITGVSTMILGWPVHARFLFEVLPVTGSGTAWVENQTLNGFLSRLVESGINLTPDRSGLVRSLTYAGAIVLTALTAWRVRRMTPGDGFGLWIVTLLIILPIAWMHYEAVLLIPLYQFFVRVEQSPRRLGRASLACYGLAWMLLCYGDQNLVFSRGISGPAWPLVQSHNLRTLALLLLMSYKFYGLLLLWYAIATDPTTRMAPLDT
jgi:hypothetical protein